MSDPIKNSNGFDDVPQLRYALCMTGKQLRAIRTSLGITQAEFGAKIAMAGNSVARMERGEIIVERHRWSY